MRIITLQPGEVIQVQAPNAVPPDPNPNPDPGPGPGPDPGPSTGVNLLLPWETGSTRYYTINHGGFGAGQIFVAQFTTGSVPSDSRGLAQISSSYYVAHGGRPGSRYACISSAPGDFTPIPVATPIGVLHCESRGNEAVTIKFGIGNAPMGEPFLQPNTTYYWNMRYDEGVDGGNAEIYLAKPAYL